MNFGDILDQYEKSQKNKKPQVQTSHKKPNAPQKMTKNILRTCDTHTAMTKWLNSHIVQDKDSDNASKEKALRHITNTMAQNMKIDAKLDLHGLTSDQAWREMENFTTYCIRQGYEKIMFIHGKGNHNANSTCVLSDTVSIFIAKHDKLGMSGHPPLKQGGKGATWVLIKQS